MPIFRKRTYGGGGNTSFKRFRTAGNWRRAAGAARNASLIRKNTTKINRMVKLETTYTTYQAKLEAANLSHQNTWWVTDPSGWTKRFGPTPGPMAMLTKVEFDLQIVPANESACITYSAFAVMLKKDTMAQIVENQGMGLATLVEGIHYTDVDHGLIPAGQVILNPDFFHVLKTYKFQIGQELAGAGAEAQRQLSKSVWRKSFKLYPKKLLKNGRGDFDPAVMSTLRNDAQVYFIVFTDNSAADAQHPTLTANCAITVKS